MGILECMRIALTGIVSNKLRSFLTMLGVIIGVGSVIAMVSLGQGASKEVTDRIAALGSNLLLVQPGRGGGRTSGATGARGSGDVLVNAHAVAIKQASAVADVAPETSQVANIRFETTSLDFTVVGTTVTYPAVRNVQIQAGRFIEQADLDAVRRVVVLGAEAALEIYGTANPVGTSIRIEQRTFEVIGVLEAKGEGSMLSPDAQVFVPLTTAQRRLFGTEFLRTINVQAISSEMVVEAEEQIMAILSASIADPDDYRITNMQEMITTLEETNRTFTLLLAGIAGVSLLVGGIGIMNIMLVSVTERTREIGIRKAIGGSKQDILLQFMVEAVVLSGCGGILGVAAGVGGAIILAELMRWPTAVSIEAIVVGFGFALLIGLFFGSWPASRAAALDPIVALRYE